MTNPFKMQELIDKLKAENASLREQNNRLKDAGNGDKLRRFQEEKTRAILFTIQAIELRTMESVNTHLTKQFNIEPNSIVIRAFRDCLRLSMHMIDPRRAANLYNALQLQNPDGKGSIPSLEEVDRLLREHADRVQMESNTSKAVYLDASTIPRGPERNLFITLRQLAAAVEDPSKDTVEELRSVVKVAEAIPTHAAAILALELAETVDNHANDIGGGRPEKLILKEALDCFLPKAPELPTNALEIGTLQ